MSTKYNAYGTQLQMGDGATPTETFVTVAACKDLPIPGGKLAMNDGTTHDSPNGYTEVIPGLKTGGTFTVATLFDPAEPTHNMSGLYGCFQNKTKKNYKIVCPTTSTCYFTFAAYVSGWSGTAPVAGFLGASVEFTITGSVDMHTS